MDVLEVVREWLPFVVLMVTVILLPLLKDKLRSEFAPADEFKELAETAATVKELDGMARRIDRDIDGATKRIDVQEASMGDLDMRLDGQDSRILRLEQRDEFTAQTMSQHIVKPLERIVTRMEALADNQGRQGQQIEALTNAIRRLEERLDRSSR